MLGSLRRTAKDAALLEMMGPNPNNMNLGVKRMCQAEADQMNGIHGQLPVCKCSGDFLGTTPPGGRVHARPPFNTWRSHTTKFVLSRIRVGNPCAESNRQTVVE